MNKKIIILLSLGCAPSFIFAAETAEPKKMKQEQTVFVQGEVRILADYVYTIADYKKYAGSSFIRPDIILQKTYNLTDEDIFIGTDYHSQECDDWDHRNHPKLGNHQLKTAYLPALKPFAYKASDTVKIQQELMQSNNLPMVLNQLIADYAQQPISLLDCRHGDVIKCRLPIAGINAQAELTCTKKYTAPFHLALRTGLIRSGRLPENLRAQIEQEHVTMKEELEKS